MSVGNNGLAILTIPAVELDASAAWEQVLYIPVDGENSFKIDVRVIVSMMVLWNDIIHIIEYDWRRLGLSNAPPLDVEYDNNIIEQ